MRRNRYGTVSRAAHHNAVKVARKLGIEPSRACPDHPSVKRTVADFRRHNGRKDEAIRRLPDLFRETPPLGAGLKFSGYYRHMPEHPCASLGQVEIGGNGFSVTVCRKHRNRQPEAGSYRSGTVGADWLRVSMPEAWRAWRESAYKPMTRPDWWTPKARPRGEETNPRDPDYSRLALFILEVEQERGKER